MLSEYIEQNQSPVIRREEFDEFAEEVEDTRQSMEQLEDRISSMEKEKE